MDIIRSIPSRINNIKIRIRNKFNNNYNNNRYYYNNNKEYFNKNLNIYKNNVTDLSNNYKNKIDDYAKNYKDKHLNRILHTNESESETETESEKELEIENNDNITNYKYQNNEKILCFQGQNINEIRSDLKERNEKFIDESFPPCFDSIMYHNKNCVGAQNLMFPILAQVLGLQVFDPQQASQRITWLRTTVIFIMNQSSFIHSYFFLI
jgi:hypothetical protein